MAIFMYEKTLGYSLEKTNIPIWSIFNNKGKMSIIQKDCFVPIVNNNKAYKERTPLHIKLTGQTNGHDIYYFSTNDTCKCFNLEVDKYFDVPFLHFDKDILKQEWNKRIDALKISKETPVYLYDIHLNDFSELLEFIKNNVKEKVQKVLIKAKKDDIKIEICLNEEMDFNCIEFECSKEDIPNLKPYVETVDCYDFSLGDISLEKLNQYFKDFGGLDLLETYFNQKKSFLPIFTSFTNEFLYEIGATKRIIAYKIIKEDNDFWYTKDKTYPKKNIKNVAQYNAYDCTTSYSIYTNDFDELIEVYNSNLEKFYV